jgi:hypothetical protein
MPTDISQLGQYGLGGIALFALVYVIINQLKLLKTMQNIVQENTKATIACTNATSANTMAVSALGELINKKIR